MNIKVTENDFDAGKRLDLFLSLHMPELSRSQIKKTIESNKVFVNGEMCFKAGYKVCENDVIEFPDFDSPVGVNPKGLAKSVFDLEILFEDGDYIFINKPIGLSVHPTSFNDNDTLVNKLLSYREDLPKTDILRPGIVHRLDKDTSGVIVVAKTPRALWWLSGQFAERKVRKEYVSIGLNQDVNFHHKKGEKFEYEGFMVRGTRNRKQFFIEKSGGEGKFSQSEFEVLDMVSVLSCNVILTKIRPLTGRTHQIRVHQKELGFPILKDRVYMSRKQVVLADKIFSKTGFKDRLYLHAFMISFESYDGKLYSVKAPVPWDFNVFVNYAAQKERKIS